MNIKEIRPEAFNAHRVFATAVAPKVITPLQAELIKIRISQINGCLFCLDMHTTKAIQLGETIRRLTALPVWREAPHFTKEEKAMFELAEKLTLIHSYEQPYHDTIDVLGEEAATDVLMTTVVINSWNRIMKNSGLLP